MTVHAPEEDDDTALVERCRRGDATAWAALVRRYQRLVYAVVTRAGFDEHGAADVFQTVFARLVEHLPRLAQPDRLQAWIVTTAKREALRARELRQRTVSMTRDEGDDSPGLEDTLAAPRFSCRWARLDVPGMGMMCSPRVSSQARASCAGLQPASCAIAS